jgi:hypothetical protein
MSKTIFRPFWSFDVVKTEKWLSEMHAKGYALLKIHFASRLFVFEKTQPAQMFYRIVFDKHAEDAAESILQDGAYDRVCCSNKFYVLRTNQAAPAMSPTYDGFLKRNKTIGMVFGYVLIFLISFYLPLLPLTIFFLADSSSPSAYYIVERIIGISLFLITFALPLLIFLKLRKTNRELEKRCGDTLDLSFTLPKDTLISKSEIDRLRKSGQMIKRTRIAWQYAPDKIEIWLEKMAQDGYRLIRLSKLGNSFFFLKGEPHKSEYHIDFQSKTDPAYFNLNKESGWKLFFTSLSRFQNLSVWGQEYTDEPPMFYSDSESQVKHARRFALTYSLCFYPVSILLVLSIVRNVILLKDLDLQDLGLQWMFVINSILFIILILELGFFATRTVLYYFRVKKTAKDG